MPETKEPVYEPVVYLNVCEVCGYIWATDQIIACPNLRNHPIILFWKERK